MPGRSGATTIRAGSVLDDYQWHDLAILRYMKNISVKIDQSIVQETSQSAFNGLDLDGKVVKTIDELIFIRLILIVAKFIIHDIDIHLRFFMMELFEYVD
jgi:hypothetical protein